MSDANYYSLLTAGEAHWKPKLCSEYPNMMMTAPTLMSTADSGVTYTFGSDTAPLAVEVYGSLTGERLVVGQYGDGNCDYVWEGDNIRMPLNRIRSFPDGAPYARYVPGPVSIDASTQPTMLPAYTRQLIVIRAVILWALRGNMRDASAFQELEANTWSEIQISLKQSNIFYGDSANRRSVRLRGLGYLWARGR